MPLGWRGRAARPCFGQGTFLTRCDYLLRGELKQEADMNGLIYLVGLIVVIMAVLSLFGLR
jgi:predicted nucleic acid-binding Zn ribbon protein